MALQQTITLPNTTGGSYIRIGQTKVGDRNTPNRYAAAHFFLFASPEAARTAPNAPITMIAALFLQGARYDDYFSKAALTAAGWNYDGQFYRALKSATVASGELFPGGALTDVSFADAVDV